MNDRVFKVVWVDKQNKLWSAMKGQRGFYRADPKTIWRCDMPLRYRIGQVTVPNAVAQGNFPFIFAFASVSAAVAWTQYDFEATIRTVYATLHPKSGPSSFGPSHKYNKGYLEVWESEGDIVKMGSGHEINVLAAPKGTLFCKSLKLIERVTNLI